MMTIKIRKTLKYGAGCRVRICALDMSFAGTYVQQAVRKFIGTSATVEGTRQTKWKPYIIKPDGYASTLCVDESEIVAVEEQSEFPF
jgi:hypothetical protein